MVLWFTRHNHVSCLYYILFYISCSYCILSIWVLDILYCVVLISYVVHAVSCLYYIVFVLYRVHIVLCFYTIVCMLYRVYIVSRLYYIVLMLYCVHILSCSCCIVFILYRVYTVITWKFKRANQFPMKNTVKKSFSSNEN